MQTRATRKREREKINQPAHIRANNGQGRHRRNQTNKQARSTSPRENQRAHTKANNRQDGEKETKKHTNAHHTHKGTRNTQAHTTHTHTHTYRHNTLCLCLHFLSCVPVCCVLSYGPGWLGHASDSHALDFPAHQVLDMEVALAKTERTIAGLRNSMKLARAWSSQEFGLQEEAEFRAQQRRPRQQQVLVSCSFFA